MVVTFAVIGLGRIGRLHAENLRFRVEGAKLVAVADVIPELAKEVGERLGVDYYTDPTKVYERKDIDAVVIATPTFLHKEMIIESLKSGKHVFVEKPMTVTSQEAREVINYVRASGRKLMVGWMRRFDPEYARAKRIVEEGGIGKVISFVSIARDPTAPPGWAADPKKSGGIFLDQLSHDFDIARWIVGEIEEVYVVGGNYIYREIAEKGDLDAVSILIRFENGAQGFIQGTRRCAFGYDLRTEIYGEKGTVFIGSCVNNLFAHGREGEIVFRGIPWFERRFFDAYIEELNAFVKAIERDEEPPITAEDGLKACLIAEACWKSFRERRPVRLSELS